MGKSNKSTIISKNIEINTILSDIGNFYRIENLNFICYGITQEEPKRLFPSNKKQYDFINLENLHKTYEFI